MTDQIHDSTWCTSKVERAFPCSNGGLFQEAFKIQVECRASRSQHLWRRLVPLVNIEPTFIQKVTLEEDCKIITFKT
jgi:hypothetical protein